MATNTTTPKKTTAATAEESAAAVTETAEARPARKPVCTLVGPAPLAGVDPVTVTLSHHLNIGGTDYQPGAEILVSPDYARRLRTQGYVSRT
ncbi:hypothetical protein [Streptomyces sp. NBC_01794]|uniref:DUF7210 family protein n=1 Tax=Streptomyces sp. NBC_01794 TaxID=2975942 RepID=UPI00308724FA|nr:hypothetical protein OIE54_09845 [Streptomyces sp. NBC_01794]